MQQRAEKLIVMPPDQLLRLWCSGQAACVAPANHRQDDHSQPRHHSFEHWRECNHPRCRINGGINRGTGASATGESARPDAHRISAQCAASTSTSPWAPMKATTWWWRRIRASSMVYPTRNGARRCRHRHRLSRHGRGLILGMATALSPEREKQLWHRYPRSHCGSGMKYGRCPQL